MSVYICQGFMVQRETNYESNFDEFIVIHFRMHLHNFYILCEGRNTNFDDTLYNYLLTSMLTIQKDEWKSALVFVSDFNAHHHKWLSSVSPIDVHGRAVHDSAGISNSIQPVTVSTQWVDKCLDPVLRDALDIVKVDVLVPMGKSDHSSINMQLDLSQCLILYSY